MAVESYTKAGSKAATPAKLDKSVFGLEVKNHQLIKDAYLSYLANGRTNNAVAKKRGEISGGGRKPWRQKGTGNARFGSSRNPIWRGGGIAFGPTGNENYNRKLSTVAKQQALRQALSLASKESRIKIIESFKIDDGKSSSAVKLINKLAANGSILLVTENKDIKTNQAVRNLSKLNIVTGQYLNVYQVMNAEVIIFEKAALDQLTAKLGGNK